MLLQRALIERSCHILVGFFPGEINISGDEMFIGSKKVTSHFHGFFSALWMLEDVGQEILQAFQRLQ